MKDREENERSVRSGNESEGMKVGHIQQIGWQTSARVTNHTVDGEIPVTHACNHSSPDVVDM